MFKKILLIYSEKLTEKHLSVIEKIKKIIYELKIESSIINIHDIEKSHFNDIDLVVTVGGDGTFIRASHQIKDIPILGINSEPEFSEGALTSLDETELERLTEILKGEYKLKLLHRINTIKNNIILDEHAINEVYIGAEKQYQTSRYTIEHNGIKEEHRSSGVLISTGSGSSAWFKSAGGKSFNHDAEKLRFIVREPFSGRIFNPKITEGELNPDDKIIFEGKRHDSGVIIIDSDKVYHMNHGDIVEITISDRPLKVIYPN